MSEIIADLAALLDLAESLAWAAVLVFVRIGAVFSLIPGFGEMVVPQRVKLALVLASTIAAAPILASQLEPGGLEPSIAALAGEAVAGLILGLALRLFLLALQTAASIIAQTTTLSQLFSGASPEPQPAIGHLFYFAGIALAFSAGLHVRAIELILLSYQILPAGGYAGAGDAADWSLALITRTFSLSFSLAAPFVVASMIYNLALGAINRAMPTLMVSMVGAPAIALGSLVMLAVASPFILAVWLEAFNAQLSNPFEIR